MIELILLPTRAATLEELKLIHTEDYIAEVQRLRTPEIEAFQIELASEMPPVSVRQRAEQYGFGEGDTPPIPGMHDVASLIAGARLWH